MYKIENIFLIQVLLVLVLGIAGGTSMAQMMVPSDDTSLPTRTIPTTDPYCGDDGYIASVLGITDAADRKCLPITISDSDSDSSTPLIPTNVSDWVLIELRTVDTGDSVSSTLPGEVVARQAAFLLNTGYVLDAGEYNNKADSDRCNEKPTVTNSSKCPVVNFSFDDELEGKELYTVVRHLNHLDIISSMAMTTTTAVNRYEYDFTNEVAARGGSLAQQEVTTDEGAKRAMYVGDINGDENINAADYLEIVNQAADYQASDINFSGSADTSDITSNRLRENLGRTSQLP